MSSYGSIISEQCEQMLLYAT